MEPAGKTRYNIVLLVVIVVNPLTVAITEASYLRLNNYLVQHVKNDSVDSNIEAAVDWLRELEATKHGFFMNILIKHLKRFVDLRRVIGDTRCGHEAYEIMRANEEAVGLHRMNDNKRVERRVDKVMLKIFQEHAEKCSRAYPIEYNTRRGQFNESVFRQVENLATIVINADRFIASSKRISFNCTPSDLFRRYITNPPTIQAFARENILYDALISNAKTSHITEKPERAHERVRVSILNKYEIKELVKELLIEPCLSFKATFGRDLFIPARFDAQVYLDLDHGNTDYFLGWSYFNICKAVTDNEIMFHNIAESAMNFH